MLGLPPDSANIVKGEMHVVKNMVEWMFYAVRCNMTSSYFALVATAVCDDGLLSMVLQLLASAVVAGLLMIIVVHGFKIWCSGRKFDYDDFEDEKKKTEKFADKDRDEDEDEEEDEEEEEEKEEDEEEKPKRFGLPAFKPKFGPLISKMKSKREKEEVEEKKEEEEKEKKGFALPSFKPKMNLAPLMNKMKVKSLPRKVKPKRVRQPVKLFEDKAPVARVTPVARVAPSARPVPEVTPAKVPRVRPAKVPRVRPAPVPSVRPMPVPRARPPTVPSATPTPVTQVMPVGTGATAAPFRCGRCGRVARRPPKHYIAIKTGIRLAIGY